MLKFAVVLLFIGSALAVEDVFKWDDIPVEANATQCVYRSEVKKLACRGAGGIVECPAFVEWPFGEVPSKFEVFGLRRDLEKSFVTPIENRIYELYPRKLDNVTYVNYTVVVEGKSVELYLYYAPTAIRSGLRVTEPKCFVKFVDIVFNKSTSKQVVEIQNGGHVELFGEVLAITKQQQKRWLGLGLLGMPWLLGMGLWGWGLGWGLPFFG